MKKILILLLLSCCASFATKADDAKQMNSLIVWDKNGVGYEFALEKLPTVSFCDSTLTVESEGESRLFHLSKIDRITYEYRGVAAIGDFAQDQDCDIRVTDEGITLQTYTEKARIIIYTTTGVTVGDFTLTQGNTRTIAIHAAGVYLVNVNGKTYKIAKP